MKTIGTKYEATKALDKAEIARLIRKDIAAAIAAGELPAVATKVRSGRSGYMGTIDIVITAAPFCTANPARLMHDGCANGNAGPTPVLLSADASAVVKKIDEIANAYNYDNSEPVTDYYESRFFISVDYSTDLRIADREELQRANGLAA